MKCVIAADLCFTGELAYWQGDYWTNELSAAQVYEDEGLAQAEVAMNIAEDGIDGLWGEDVEIVPAQ